MSFFLSFFLPFFRSFIHSFISFSFDDDILARSLASGVCERYTVVGRKGVGSFSYESSCWSFFCWCCAGALGLSGLLACAESGSAGSVKLFSWVPGCCGLERNVYKTSRPSPWLAFFLAMDLIPGTDRFGLAN